MSSRDQSKRQSGTAIQAPACQHLSLSLSPPRSSPSDSDQLRCRCQAPGASSLLQWVTQGCREHAGCTFPLPATGAQPKSRLLEAGRAFCSCL